MNICEVKKDLLRKYRCIDDANNFLFFTRHYYAIIQFEKGNNRLRSVNFLSLKN